MHGDGILRYLILACIGSAAAAMAGVLFVPASGSAARPHAAAASSSLCKANEDAIFQCRIGRGIAAVCAGRSGGETFVQYRFGRPGAIELAYPASGTTGLSWARTGYSGGGELQVNFLNEGHRYVLYSRVVRTGFGPEGNLPDFQAGVAVVRGNRIISDRRCTDTDNPWRQEPDRLLPEGEFTAWWDLED